MHEKMDLMLTVTTPTGTQTFSLGASHLESIVGSYMSDATGLAELFALAASHPSYAIRRAVASSEHLPIESAIEMAADPSNAVRVQIASNDIFRRSAPEDLVLQLIESDPEVAEVVANYVERFESADVNVLCAALARHPDVVVRRTLATNSGTPTRWVKKLTNDPVIDVANMARQALEARLR